MKLGLLAMSGVRAHDPELTALGLTLPGFVERKRVVASLPSLGLLTLAGLTPARLDVRYLDVPELRPRPWIPEEFDVVAISSFSAQIREAYELADRYRAAGTRVVLGGLHVTAVPGEAIAHADAIVIGEGEPVWAQAVADLEANRLQRVYDARGRRFDLADAPMPRFELLDVSRYNRLTVQTQRGCPHDCEFCAASIRLAPGFKVKPVDKVIDEIRCIKSIWRQPFVEFADDNTFVNRPHARALMRRLADEHVRWFTETDLSVADDRDLLALMRDSGCAQVLIGFEAATRAPLAGVERRADWKARRFDRYREAIDRIQSAGITVNGCFVLGLDGSGPEVFEDVYDFVVTSGLYEVQITVLTPFPGTPLHARLLHEGRLLQPDAWELCTLFDLNFIPARMSVTELRAGFVELSRRLYDGAAVRARRRAFHQRMRVARARAKQPSALPAA